MDLFGLCILNLRNYNCFTENYDSLEEASKGIERHLDSLFFEYGVIDVPTSIFRIVKCKQKGVVNV